jgi:hypothetical protein
MSIIISPDVQELSYVGAVTGNILEIEVFFASL